LATFSARQVSGVVSLALIRSPSYVDGFHDVRSAWYWSGVGWAAMHQQELRDNWERLRNDESPQRIDPLE
jgi:hypothetical protein